MHEALLIIARAIALAHDHWRSAIGRSRPLSGRILDGDRRLPILRLRRAA